jgi:asparagine synthase (glutamine-hydrolysing)
VFHAHEERIRGILPSAMRRKILGPIGRLYPKADWAPRPLRAKATLLALAGDGAEGYARALSIVPTEWRGTLYGPDMLRQIGDYRAERSLIDVMVSAPARSGLDRAQYADLKFWLPGDILTKVDRTSMAVSLEAREPLLDHRLVEFAASLPERTRVRGAQGKWLLKKAMRRYLPDEILYRPKQGFVTPIAQWLRGPLADETRAIASSAALARTEWFNGPVIGKLAQAHVAGRADNSRLLWQLLMLDKSLVKLGLIA